MQTKLTLDQFKAFNPGNGLVCCASEAKAQSAQRHKAVDAYLDAFPLRAGEYSYRKHMDAAIQYGNYQVCRDRGFVTFRFCNEATSL